MSERMAPGERERDREFAFLDAGAAALLRRGDLDELAPLRTAPPPPFAGGERRESAGAGDLDLFPPPPVRLAGEAARLRCGGDALLRRAGGEGSLSGAGG
ncbi:MAG: hypothetical protein WDW36_005842 [Sanguina aurantia]